MGNRSNLGVFLAAISVVIMVGPIVSSVIIYKGDLVALVMPNIDELRDEIETRFPTVEYVGYEVTDPRSSFRVTFNVTNNSDEDLTFSRMEFSAYCSQHDGVFLGYGRGVGFPLIISGRSSRILSVQVTFIEEAQSHILTHHQGDMNFHVTLKKLLVVVQGVEVEIEEEIDIGPIGILQ